MSASPPASSRKRLWAALILVALVAGGALLWRTMDPQRRFERWLEGMIREAYREAAGPNPALELADVDVSARLGEVAQGRIDSLGLAFEKRAADGKRADLRIRVEGPLEINQDLLSRDFKTDLEVKFSPKVRVHTPPGSPWGVPEIALAITAVADPGGRRLKSLEIVPSIPSWKENPIQLSIEGPALSLAYDGAAARLAFEAKSITWQPTDSRAVNLSALKGSVSLPLTLDPFVVGPEVRVEGSLAGAEVLWDDAYGEFPLAGLPARLTATLDPRAEHRDLPVESATLELGPAAKPLARVEARPADGGFDASLRTDAIPIRSIWETVLMLFPEGTMESLDRFRNAFEVLGGTLSVTASLSAKGKMDGTLKVRGARLATPDRIAEVAGLDLTLPLDSARATAGELKARTLRYRRLTGSIEPTRFELIPRMSEDPLVLYELEAPEGLRVSFAQVPWKMGRLRARLARPGADIPAFWAGASGLKIGPVSAKELTAPLCLRRDTPDASFVAELSRATLSPGALQLFGKLELRLFGGYARVTDPKVFAPLSLVPETQFTAEWNRIRLDKLGRWSGFGEMEGVLKGYARNVVVQGWLPTQYELRAELKPDGDDDIVFTTKAVENMILVLSGEDFRKQVPGIARFFMVDIPDFLAPDFSIQWAGVKLLARDGWVMIEDLTPKERLDDGMWPGAGQRYFVYGTRVRVPFNASTYPVVLDATAMANYTRKMAAYFQTIIENKRREEQAKLEQSQQGVPQDDVPSLCLPDPVP